MLLENFLSLQRYVIARYANYIIFSALQPDKKNRMHILLNKNTRGCTMTAITASSLVCLCYTAAQLMPKLPKVKLSLY